MQEIRLDLAADATRAGIRTQVYALLDENEKAAIEETVAPLRKSGGHYHDLGEVYEALHALAMGEKATADAEAVYLILAQAEARVHGCPVEQTHFHEVGNASSVADVVSICLAIEALGNPRILATSVQVGSGKVKCAHGLLDIPAPATAAILERGIPIAPEKLDGERCTPTSAALICHFADEFV